VARMIRLSRGVGLALIVAVLFSSVVGHRGVARADSGGVCASNASAWAAAYDGSSTGSASGSVQAGNYSLDACVGLAQTNAIFVAGGACESAGISAGGASGLGYAVVSWSAVWRNGDQTVEVSPDAPQQYDCGDTFS
jgi:hypothetical protein